MANEFSVVNTVRKGVQYLLDQQRLDGSWQEYQLPVGNADAWITGYVGLSLASLAGNDGAFPVQAAVHRAAAWLVETRPYAAGWGYNGSTGPDADSTALALRLLSTVGFAHTRKDETWLIDRWKPGGGVATFPRSDAWGDPHPDVTAVAFLAFPETLRAALCDELSSYLNRTRQPDGTWPSYWWRSSHYATYNVGLLVRHLGLLVALPLLVVDERETHRIATDLDLILATGTAIVLGAPVANDLIDLVCQRQATDGRWSGGPNLRVTDPMCSDPWLRPVGRLYTDLQGLITTATAVKVLGGVF